MSDVSALVAEVRTLSALLKESQQQAQERHRDYLDGRQTLQIQMQTLRSGNVGTQLPQPTVSATSQKTSPQSSSQSRPTQPPNPHPRQSASSRSQPKPPVKLATQTPVACGTARAAPAQKQRVSDVQDVDDGNEGLPEGWEVKNRKRGARLPATNERNALVRDIVQRFLGYATEPRTDDRDGKVYSEFPPSPAILDPLPESLAEASSIDWESKLSSAYNHRIIVLLIAEIRTHNHTGFYYTTKEIAAALKEHLRYLREVRKAVLSPVDSDVEARERLYHSANTRKNSLSASRLAFILHYRLAQYFHVSPNMLEILLGVDCTSEDELDYSFDSATYRIRRLRWRSPMLTAFLRLVDKCMELRSRRKGGSNTRTRIPGFVDDTDAAAPEGFPENWFDCEYLDELDDWGRQALLISPEVTVDWDHLHSALKALIREERTRLREHQRAGGVD